MSWTGSTNDSTASCGASSIDADILTSAAPASLGGDGFGVLEQVAVLVALGHQLAAVPVPGVGGAGRRGAGPVRLRGAAAELGRAGGRAARRSSPSRSTAKWVRGRCRPPVPVTGYRLTGTRTQVGFGPVADAFLVPAETDSGAAVFLVAADDPGVTVTAHRDHRLGQRRAPDAGRRPRWTAGARLATARSWRLARHACHLGPQRLPARSARARTADDRRIRPHPRAVRPPDRQLPGGGAAAGRRLHRRQGAAADADPGGLAGRRRTSPPRSTWPARRSGPPMPGTGWRTPSCTCTAASASTPITRCTVTSWPPRRPSSRCGGATGQLRRIGRNCRPC